jgi:tRNA uridine 5-carbamoylmethylation protein Kti12
MNLVFIYGPPASGKLTVATELSKLTGYNVFHNHLTSDLVREVLDFGTKDFFDLSNKLRMEIFEAAAKKKINLIFTVCYVAKSDDLFVKKVIKSIKSHHGKVFFVHLLCNKTELKRRVKEKSRKSFGKIKTPNKLGMVLRKHEFYASIPFVESYKIDNTKISAKKTAHMIKSHYLL